MAWSPVRAVGHPLCPPAGAIPAVAAAADLRETDEDGGCWSVLVEKKDEELEESVLGREAEEADQSVVIEDYKFGPSTRPLPPQRQQHKQHEEETSLPPQPSPTPPPPSYQNDDNGNETNDEGEEVHHRNEEVGEWDFVPELGEASFRDDKPTCDDDRHNTRTPDTLPISPSCPAHSPFSPSSSSSSSPTCPSPTDDWTDVDEDRTALPPSCPPALNSLVCWIYLDEWGNEFAYSPQSQVLLEHEWRNGRDHAQLWIPPPASSSSSSSSSSPSIIPYIVHFASSPSNIEGQEEEREDHIQVNRVTGTQRKVKRLTRGPRPPSGVGGAVRRMKVRLRKGKKAMAALDAETVLQYSRQKSLQAGRALHHRAPSKEQVATAALAVASRTITYLDRVVRRMSTEVQHHRERQQKEQQQQQQQQQQKQQQQQQQSRQEQRQQEQHQQQQHQEEKQAHLKSHTYKIRKSDLHSPPTHDFSPSPATRESRQVLAGEREGKRELDAWGGGGGGAEGGEEEWVDSLEASVKIRQGPLLDLGEEGYK